MDWQDPHEAVAVEFLDCNYKLNMAFQGSLRSGPRGKKQRKNSGNFGLPVDKLGEEAVASFSALGCAGEPQVTPPHAVKGPRSHQRPMSLPLSMTQTQTTKSHIQCFRVWFEHSQGAGTLGISLPSLNSLSITTASRN